MAVDKTASITVNSAAWSGFVSSSEQRLFRSGMVGLDRAFLFIDGKLIGRVESPLQKAIYVNALEAALARRIGT
jgi:hypothetical protein